MNKQFMLLITGMCACFGASAMQRRAVTDIYAAIKRDDKEAIDRFIAAGQAHLAEHVQMCVPGGEPEEAREVAGQEYELRGVGVSDTRLAMTPLYFAIEKKKIASVRKLIMDGAARLDAGRWVVRRGGWRSRPNVEFSSAAVALARCAANHADACTLLHDVVSRGTRILSGFRRTDDEMCDELLHPNNHGILLEAIKHHTISPEQLTARLDRLISFMDHTILLEAIKQRSIGKAQLLAKFDKLVALKDPLILVEIIKQGYMTPDQFFEHPAVWSSSSRDSTLFVLEAMLREAFVQGVSLECQEQHWCLCERCLAGLALSECEVIFLQNMVKQRVINLRYLRKVADRVKQDDRYTCAQYRRLSILNQSESFDYPEACTPDDIFFERIMSDFEREENVSFVDFIHLLSRGRKGDFEKIFTAAALYGYREFIDYMLTHYHPGALLIEPLMPHLKNIAIKKLLQHYLYRYLHDDFAFADESKGVCSVAPIKQPLAGAHVEPSAPPAPIEQLLAVACIEPSVERPF